MTEILTDITAMALPYKRQAKLKYVEFDGGMKMVRLILREGTRITQLDLDAASATALGAALVAAATDL